MNDETQGETLRMEIARVDEMEKFLHALVQALETGEAHVPQPLATWLYGLAEYDLNDETQV